MSLNPFRPGAFARAVTAARDTNTPPQTLTEARTQREELTRQARAAEQNLASLTQVNRSRPNGAIRAELDTARTEVQRLWHQAGQAAAREIELFPSGAGPGAVRAHADGVRATTDHPSFQAGMQARQATVATEQQERSAERQAAQVQDAYQQGGAPAAAAELNRLTATATPEEALALVNAAQPTIDRITTDLRQGARGADGDQISPFSPNAEAQVQFDRIVADLSAATTRAAGAPGGQEALGRVAANIVTAIREGGIGRFDEALGNSILGGNPLHPDTDPANSSSALAVEVMRQLSEAGETGKADDILQNVQHATSFLNERVSQLSGSVNQHNADLAQLLQDWGPTLTEEQRTAAIQSFRESHPEYAQLEALAGPALRTMNELHQLPPAVASLGHADDLSGRIDTFLQKAPEALLQTETGQEELAKLLQGAGESGGNLLDRIDNVADTVRDRTRYLEQFGSALLNNSVAQALSASAAGDLAGVERAVSGLQAQARVFGLGPGQMEDITDSLRQAATAQTQDAAGDALTRLDRSLQNLEAEGIFSRQGGFGQTFRAAGVLLGAISTADSVQEAIRDPNFMNVVNALGSAAGTGQAGIQLVGNMTRNLALLNGGAATALRSISNVTGVIGAGFSAFQAAQAFEDGDPARGALLAAQAAGAVAALAGATGVGFVVVAGAGLALMQLQRVRASNRFENEHTEAFLQAAGFSPELTRHLRNADDKGRSVGPVINALAEHLGQDPVAFFGAMRDLSPSQVLTMVEAMHGVDPNGDGVFPATAPNDVHVGAGNPFVGRPHSLTGLATFLDQQGFELPGV